MMCLALRGESMFRKLLTSIVAVPNRRSRYRQASAAQTPIKFDSETISGLGARNIGSATMSGRIAAIDAVREGSRLTV